MRASARIKVSLYIPCHNYGRYLPQAVDSVLGQIMTEWDLVIINDGSSDNTTEIADAYAGKYPGKIRVHHHDKARGLLRCANVALEMVKGEYIMRLDADDFLDESALLVMSQYLDRNLDIALVYPNYFYVDKDGHYLRMENRKKVGTEAKLLDLPAHGACTMVRKRILKSVGGYSEEVRAQDGHELWLKIIHRYRVGSVSTPLFHYRQHDESLSRDTAKILSNRQQVKRLLAQKSEGPVKPRIVAIVPVKNTYPDHPNIALHEIAGKPLLDYTLDSARRTGLFNTIFVSTDDPAVIEHCRNRAGIVANLRPEALSHHDVRFSRVVYDAVTQLEEEYDVFPDIVVILNVHTPLRKPEQIVKAVDTLLLYNSDSVISVVEDWAIHFKHGLNGLEPLNPAMINRVRLEREALFVDNGALKVAWRDSVGEEDLFGEKISHIVMSLEDSVIASSEANIWLIAHILNRQRTEHEGRQIAGDDAPAEESAARGALLNERNGV